MLPWCDHMVYYCNIWTCGCSRLFLGKWWNSTLWDKASTTLAWTRRSSAMCYVAEGFLAWASWKYLLTEHVFKGARLTCLLLFFGNLQKRRSMPSCGGNHAEDSCSCKPMMGKRGPIASQCGQDSRTVFTCLISLHSLIYFFMYYVRYISVHIGLWLFFVKYTSVILIIYVCFI